MKWITNSKTAEFSSIIEDIYPYDHCVRDSHDYINMNSHARCRNITFQVTDECNCACTYCYQINKHHTYMTKEVGKKIVDLIFDMWYENKSDGFINQEDTRGIILDFIGGEPLLNIEVIDYICDYFWTRCILENHPWRDNWMASLSSNGALYFSPEFQQFLKKYGTRVSYSITVDGPKEIHDTCRVYKDGSGGNFKDAYAALMNYKSHFRDIPGTKITIAKENLPYLNTIVDFFFRNGIYTIFGNVVFEHEWTIEESTEFYKQLKSLADSLLRNNHDAYVSFFDFGMFKPMDEADNQNYCGGSGAMLAFDPTGIAYPCLRYMASSLGTTQPPIIIGNCDRGIYQTPEEIETKTFLDSITRRSQSTDECFYCPIAQGCAWCSGWNYQETGSVNCRSTRICNSHKARSLANVYFWNKYYLQEHINKTFHRYLPNEEALKFIDQKELDMLNDLENQTKQLVQEVEQ